ncbi:hypothetical protein, partial [Xanthomonas euvesicatoria]|uniref:hypothetical protein n=1 Tax=Xanthomonas euvesicatoria TaxID=456327 RepID=UPI0032B48FF9
LLQRGDDLAIGELALAHWWSPWWLVCPETSSYGWIKFTGSRQWLLIALTEVLIMNFSID